MSITYTYVDNLALDWQTGEMSGVMAVQHYLT